MQAPQKKATERKFYPPVYEGENTVHSTFTIVNVSEKLQIKVYLGKLQILKLMPLSVHKVKIGYQRMILQEIFFQRFPINVL